jgi:hypothetical protein
MEFSLLNDNNLVNMMYSCSFTQILSYLNSGGIMNTAIYKAIKDHNTTVIAIANDVGVTRSCIYQSIGGGGSRAIRVRLAILTELPPTKIWGNFYQYQLDDLFYEKQTVKS